MNILGLRTGEKTKQTNKMLSFSFSLRGKLREEPFRRSIFFLLRRLLLCAKQQGNCSNLEKRRAEKAEEAKAAIKKLPTSGTNVAENKIFGISIPT